MIPNIMTKKILLFIVFFAIVFLTGTLFIRSINSLAIQTPIVIQSSTPISKNVETSDMAVVIEENVEIISNIVTEETMPFSFVVLADAETYKTPSHQNDIFEHMLAKAASYKPNFALFTGDLLASDSPDKSRLHNVKKIIEKYYTTYYIAIGKHDIECGIKCIDAWNEVFYDKKHISGEKRILYHSFDYENTHFVLISSEYPIKHSIDDKQLTWLDNDLTNTDKEHIIVASHVPPVNFFKESAKACHDMSCSEPQRTKLINILKKHHVDLVLSGHEHVFDHKIIDGIDFVIAGNNGNGKRYKDSTWEDSFSQIHVSDKHITLKAIGSNGNLIREIQIK